MTYGLLSFFCFIWVLCLAYSHRVVFQNFVSPLLPPSFSLSLSLSLPLSPSLPPSSFGTLLLPLKLSLLDSILLIVLDVFMFAELQSI